MFLVDDIKLFFTESENFRLLTGVFKEFTFNMITDWLG